MNTFKYISLALVGLSSLASLSQAQAAASAKIDAVIQYANNKKAQKLTLDKAAGAGKFSYTDKMADQILEGSVAKCKTFLLQTPAEHNLAMRAYRAGDIANAYRRLGAVKKKYAAFIGLPGNPAAEAAIYEIKSAIRLQDWTLVKKLADAFPSPRLLTNADSRFLEVAKLLGFEDSDASGSVEAIQGFLNTKSTVAALDLETYGLALYGLARATAANVPAAELTAGVLSADSAKGATQAIDLYCQAAMAQRGANPEVIADCMTRAAKLLWAMPDVKDAAAMMVTESPSKAWKSAPANLKDAATMAYLVLGMYPVEAVDPALPEMAKCYYNPSAPAK